MLFQNFLSSANTVGGVGMVERSLANYNLAALNQLAIFGDPVAASLEGSSAILHGTDPLLYGLGESGRGSNLLFDTTTYSQILDWLNMVGSAAPGGAVGTIGVQAAAALGKTAAETGKDSGVWKFIADHTLLVVIGLILFGAGLLMIVFDNKETIVKVASSTAKAAAL